MIGAILPLLLQAAAPAPAAKPAEHWEPWLDWGCRIRETGRAPYVLNGIIARSEDPTHPDPAMRVRKALRVLRDDSSVIAGRQARSPLFVVRRPTEFWALFLDTRGGKAESRMLVLKFKELGETGTVLLDAGPGESEPYARGECVSRLAAAKAKS